MRLAKQSQLNPYPEKRGEYDEFLIMPANGRWDLIRRLKVKGRHEVNVPVVTFVQYVNVAVQSALMTVLYGVNCFPVCHFIVLFLVYIDSWQERE